MQDIHYMNLAIELAKKGCGFVNPNPVVGAIIVKDSQIIGQGYHENYAGNHAEINALRNCKQPPKGATMYVTLEPCSHYGNTPPCVKAIVKSGIKKVIIGSHDPNPLVAGKGIDYLKKNNIKVIENILEKECNKLNYIFFHYIQTGLPLVTMKYAMTMDGKIATYTGKSKWITGKSARQKVHQDRHRYSGIMVGVNTVIEDDPLLTCRLKGGKNPIRIICDTNLRTPLDSKIVTSAKIIPTIIATSLQDTSKHKDYIDAGCKIIIVPKKENHIDLQYLVKELGKKKIDSILLEGGGRLNWSALDSKIVNRVQAYIAPKLFGGSSAITPIEGLGIEDPNQAFLLKADKISRLGEDILVESEVIYDVYRNH